MFTLANYSFALFCEPVGSYRSTDIRRETAEEARQTHEFLKRAYDESGIPVVVLPPLSVDERVQIVSSIIERHSIQ